MQGPLTEARLPGGKVTKAKLAAYVERTFARADKDKDGALNFEELQVFLRMLCHPYEVAPPAQSESQTGK